MHPEVARGFKIDDPNHRWALRQLNAAVELGGMAPESLEAIGGVWSQWLPGFKAKDEATHGPWGPFDDGSDIDGFDGTDADHLWALTILDLAVRTQPAATVEAFKDDWPEFVCQVVQDLAGHVRHAKAVRELKE